MAIIFFLLSREKNKEGIAFFIATHILVVFFSELLLKLLCNNTTIEKGDGIVAVAFFVVTPP
jgi:hypothetical protein